MVDECFVTEDQLRLGQALVLAPEQGQANPFSKGMQYLKLKTVRLTFLTPQDVESLCDGTPTSTVRMTRMARMAQEAFEQGACLTTAQLALILGLVPSVVSRLIQAYHETHGEFVPLRGIVEDCSGATSHKAQIVKLHLEGLSTSEIAQKTKHNPKNVERYVRRFNQVREFVGYLERPPEPQVVARILGMGDKLAREYLDLLPEKHG